MGRMEEEAGKKELAPDELQLRGLTLRAVGWLLLVFDAIIVVYVFVGIRSGSYLWLFWAAIEGLVGAGLVLAGMRREAIATRALAQTARQHLSATGQAEQHKAA
jgi:hypothetical protein